MAKNILIVDDDDDDIDFIREAVKEIDPHITCITAGNGRDALNLLKGFIGLPDYIFLDMNMPKMNGKQCLIELKNDDLFKHIAVIMCSTSKSDRDIKECIGLGAVEYLAKPFFFKDWIKQLTSLFNRL